MATTGEIPTVNVNERTTFSWPVVVAFAALAAGVGEARVRLGGLQEECAGLRARVLSLEDATTEQRIINVRMDGKLDRIIEKLEAIESKRPALSRGARE